jgi:hypothetical protein
MAPLNPFAESNVSTTFAPLVPTAVLPLLVIPLGSIFLLANS